MVCFHHSHVLDVERPWTLCCDSRHSRVFWVDRPGLTPRTPLHITFWLCSPWLNPSRFLNWSILLAVSCCSPDSREVQISIYHFVFQSGCSRILDLVYTAFITPPREAESGLSCGLFAQSVLFLLITQLASWVQAPSEAHTVNRCWIPGEEMEVTSFICFIYKLWDSILSFPWQEESSTGIC